MKQRNPPRSTKPKSGRAGARGLARRPPIPLRLIAFSDCRVQDPELILRWVAARAPRPHLILYAGDDIRRFHPDDETNYFERLAQHAEFGLCAVAGNDDEPSVRRLIRGARVYEVHSTPLEIAGWVVIGLEGVESPGLGSLQHTAREITEHLRRGLAWADGRPIIVLSHSPPKGCADRAMRFGLDHIGSTALKAAVAKSADVRLVVCGHAHLSGGESDHCGGAYVINVASHDNDANEPARMVEIDLDASGSSRVWQTLLEGPAGTVAILSGIGAPTAERLDKVGLGTLQALAAADPATVRELVPKIGTPPAILVARARAQIEQRPIVFAPINLPAAPRIYFDIETDLKQQRIWLIGAFLEEEDRVHQFAATSFDEERGMLVEFADFVSSQPSASFVSFSSNHLDHWLTIRRLRHHGLPASESIAAKNNAYHLLWRSLALPTTTFGLKEIASCLGYQFQHPDMDGRRVAWEYEYHVQERREEIPTRLMQYNADDVRAVHFSLMAAQRLHQANLVE